MILPPRIDARQTIAVEPANPASHSLFPNPQRTHHENPHQSYLSVRSRHIFRYLTDPDFLKARAEAVGARNVHVTVEKQDDVTLITVKREI